MVRFALLVLLTACNGNGNGDDTGPVEDADGDGYTTAEGDCNDNDATINPGATEIWYDGDDQDCSGGSDNDQDGDGVDIGTASNRDCDDEDPNVHPGATEVWYNGVDENCDEESDFDQDGDGFDAATHGGNDCDDTNEDVNPDADELCSTTYDDDCEGGINENDAVDAAMWYPDLDEDTFGSPEGGMTSCLQPSGYVSDNTDCNDDPTPGVGEVMYPDAADVPCDGFDNDCDPLTFEAGAISVNEVPSVLGLEAVLDAAVDNDVIELCEGKYLLNDVDITDSVTLRGLADPEVTILEAEQVDIDTGPGTFMHGAPLLQVMTTAEVTIEALTLTKGGGRVGDNDLEGGGLYVVDAGDVILRDVIITENGSGLGSGIYAGTDAALTLTRVAITDNVGVDHTLVSGVYPVGGGMYLLGGVSVIAEDLSILGNESNLAGGVYAWNGVSIVDAGGTSVVAGNDGGLEGGGLLLFDGCTVTGLAVNGNVAIAGGGINAVEGPTLPEHTTLTDVSMSGNLGTLVGGGLWASGEIDLVRVVFDGNRADHFGGNLYVGGTSTVVTMDGGAVLRGLLDPGVSFARGGGLHLRDAVFESILVDWGTGSPDNARQDVWLDNSATGPGAACNYGAATSFVVDDGPSTLCP